MSIDYIRRQYSVPAKKGGRVEYTGNDKPEFGTICGAQGAHLTIRLDGMKHTMPYHPTWKLRYLDADTSTVTPTHHPKGE